MLGRPWQIIGTVTALEPQRTLSYEYATGPIRGRWEYRIMTNADQSRLEFKLEMPSRGFLSTSNPLLFNLIKREIPQKPLVLQVLGRKADPLLNNTGGQTPSPPTPALAAAAALALLIRHRNGSHPSSLLPGVEHQRVTNRQPHPPALL